MLDASDTSKLLLEIGDLKLEAVSCRRRPSFARLVDSSVSPRGLVV